MKKSLATLALTLLVSVSGSQAGPMIDVHHFHRHDPHTEVRRADEVGADMTPTATPANGPR